MKSVNFVIHEHNGRKSGLHYDFRYENPENIKELYSFSMPHGADIFNDKRTVMTFTKMHDRHWLKYSSYRAKIVDQGTLSFVRIMSERDNYVIQINGDKLKGQFMLFKVKNNKNQWVLAKLV